MYRKLKYFLSRFLNYLRLDKESFPYRNLEHIKIIIIIIYLFIYLIIFVLVSCGLISVPTREYIVEMNVTKS